MISNAVASSSSSSPLKDLSEHKERKSHNKLGANQYKDRPLLHDPHVSELLNGYHSKGITDNRIISKLLLEEHNVILGERSIYRRKKMLGLWASKRTTQDLSDAVKRQLVMTQMAKDATGKLGAQVIKKNIFRDTGLHLTRDYIRAEMKKLDPVAHAARCPAHNAKNRYIRQAEREAAAAAAAAESASMGPLIDSSTEAQPGGSGQTSISQGSTQNAQVHRPAQSLYNPPSTQITDPRRQSSTTSRITARAAQRPPLSSVTPSLSLASAPHAQPPMPLPIHNDPPSFLSSQTITYPPAGYDAPLNLLASPPPAIPPISTRPPVSSTSSYHHPQTSALDDQNDEDGDYSEDESDNDNHPDYPAIVEEMETQAASTSTVREIAQATAEPRTPVQPSAAMESVVHRLQDATPNIRDLTRAITSLNMEDEGLDSMSYDVVLQAMEAAALLERQLSRVIAQARESGTRRMSGS